MPGRADVVVVGGGLAGLTVARDLAPQGARVVLVEARERPGGRVWSPPFPGLDERVELGGAWFDAEAQPVVAEEARRRGVRLRTAAGLPAS